MMFVSSFSARPAGHQSLPLPPALTTSNSNKEGHQKKMDSMVHFNKCDQIFMLRIDSLEAEKKKIDGNAAAGQNTVLQHNLEKTIDNLWDADEKIIKAEVARMQITNINCEANLEFKDILQDYKLMSEFCGCTKEDGSPPGICCTRNEWQCKEKTSAMGENNCQHFPNLATYKSKTNLDVNAEVIPMSTSEDRMTSSDVNRRDAGLLHINLQRTVV